jgi:hypothetical protein
VQFNTVCLAQKPFLVLVLPQFALHETIFVWLCNIDFCTALKFGLVWFITFLLGTEAFVQFGI